MKKDGSLYNNLLSKNKQTVISSIDEARNNCDEMIIERMVNEVILIKDKEITAALVSFLNDLKYEPAVPIIVEALKNKNLKKFHAIIASACWQNGMDYSKYIHEFITITIDESFKTAIETFCVIENSVSEVDKDILSLEILRIEKALIKIKEADKRNLVSELLKVLKEQIRFM